MANYDSLVKQWRALESSFNEKLTSYSRLALTITRQQHDIETGGWKDAEVEVEQLLEKLRETNNELLALSNNPSTPSSQSMYRAIQRQRDVEDYAKELHRTKTNVQRALSHVNLLSGVRNDIEAYKSSAADSLLAERGTIDSSHRMADQILDQAYESRAEFSRQSMSLASINTRMTGVISTMPGINDIVSMIKGRRRRDSIILGILIGACFLLLISYLSQ